MSISAKFNFSINHNERNQCTNEPTNRPDNNTSWRTLRYLIPYLSGRTGVSCPALRLHLFGREVRIPDVTVGHNSLLVVLGNHARETIVNSLT